MKICPKCSNEKDFEHFRIDNSRVSGVYPYCIECERIFRNDYMAIWRQREHALEYNKEYNLNPINRANKMFRSARLRAEKKKEPFKLCKYYVQMIVCFGKCQRTNIPFDFTNNEEKRFNPFAPSIDKIDFKKPYSNENVQIVIDWYNRAKNQNSDVLMYHLCKKVTENPSNKAEYERASAQAKFHDIVRDAGGDRWLHIRSR